jgi:hypothetical protein
MLRFVKSKDEPEEMCELYQIVDLRDLADEISRHATSVEASAFFNGISVDIPDDEFSFGITVFAFSEDPSEQSQLSPLRWENALTFSGSRTPADADEESWQKVITTLPLPPDTRYLVVQLGVIRTDPDESDDVFPGQFVDKVSVNLICQK